MAKTTNDDSEYSIHAEVDHILGGIRFEDEHPAPVASMKTRLRKYLTERAGANWKHAAIREHTMPDGSSAWTASLICVSCRTIHTYIAIDIDGEVVLANEVGE